MPKVQLVFDWEPSVVDIWPDGDWPSKPTKEDLSRELSTLVREEGVEFLARVMMDCEAAYSLHIDGDGVDLDEEVMGEPEWV